MFNGLLNSWGGKGGGGGGVEGLESHLKLKRMQTGGSWSFQRECSHTGFFLTEHLVHFLSCLR